MIARPTKISVRFVPVTAERAQICQRTAIELQAESILRASRGEADVSGEHTNGYDGKKSQNYGP